MSACGRTARGSHAFLFCGTLITPPALLCLTNPLRYISCMVFCAAPVHPAIPFSVGRSHELVCLDAQALDGEDIGMDSIQLPASVASSTGIGSPEQTSAPGNRLLPSDRAAVAADTFAGAWSVLARRVADRTENRRERSSPAQFRRHGPFQKAVLPSVLWTLDPADDGGELVAGVEAEAISAAKAIAAAARELASRALGFEL